MDKKRLVSVIVPIYNAEAYIDDCINSILAQTYKSIEIILVNDGSSDKSGEICEAYARRFSNIHYYQQINQGQNAARFQGVKKANGDWILFVDADDFIAQNMCERYVCKQIESNADMIIGCRQKYFNGTLKKRDVQNIKFGMQTGLDVARQFLLDYGRRVPPLALWSILFRKKDIKEALESIDLGINFNEDCACVLYVLIKVNKVCWIQDALYYYRVSQTSFTQQHDKNILSGQRKLLLYWEELLKDRDELVDIKDLCNKFIIRNLMLGGYEFFSDFPGLFPFVKFEGDKCIALYGAGILGEEIREKISHKFKITSVFDQSYSAYQKFGRHVKNPSEIDIDKYDYIVVSIWNKNIAESVAEKLRKTFGNKKILTINDEILNSDYTYRKIEELKRLSNQI